MSLAEDDENSVSMIDVLEEEKQLEADANAVLAGSDDKNCTYPQGCVPRQALYSCATCVPSVMEPAGICLACSLQCHDGHDLYELYTKRNFRCDCGNSRFPDTPCKLVPDKENINANKYNQNFRGLYCTCARPYPDPEDDTEDEMIQCIVCEDWYHGRHLGTTTPSDYQEMICTECMKACEFLWPYTVLGSETTVMKTSETPNCSFVDVESFTPAKSDSAIQKPASEEPVDQENDQQKSETTDGSSAETTEPQEHLNEESKEEKQSDNNCVTSCARVSGDIESPPRLSTQPDENGHGDDKTDLDTVTCKLKELQKRSVKYGNHASFWPEGWRTKLCTCDKCKEMYFEKGVGFLPDALDTVQAYEEKGCENTPSQYDQGMQALANMHRMQQVEVLSEYNELRSELTDYLKSFADNKKVVREEDIKEFFGQLQSRKRQKTSQSAMSYYCK